MLLPRHLAAVIFLAGATTLAAAQTGAPGMLERLPGGRWIVTSRDGAAPRALCLGNPWQLVQLRHAGSACSRFVVESAGNKMTVHYTCKGDGYGRTSLRRETATLVQIDSQGIEGGRPFQFKAEARRTGACR